MTKQPKQLKLSTLAALCTALDCQPSELIEVDTTPLETPRAKPRPQGRRSAGGSRTPPPF